MVILSKGLQTQGVCAHQSQQVLSFDQYEKPEFLSSCAQEFFCYHF